MTGKRKLRVVVCQVAVVKRTVAFALTGSRRSNWKKTGSCELTTHGTRIFAVEAVDRGGFAKA